MSEHNPFTQVRRELGALGIPFTELRGTGTLLEGVRHTASLGCGAWVGRSVCGAPATLGLVGPVALKYMAHTALETRYGTWFAAVCARHGANPHAFTADTPAELQANQMREYFAERVGTGEPMASEVDISLVDLGDMLAELERRGL